MCKEHIKALKQVIKSNNKNTLPILKCMCHSNGTLKATNLEQMVEVEIPTIADGIWKDTALDYGFREDTKETDWTIADYPEVDLKGLVQEVELSEEDMAKIIRASEFVSKDTTRPVLTGVVLKGGNIYATDGYKMYRNKMENELTDTINLPTGCIKILKTVKADKQGTWTLSVYENEQVVFTHGKFRLYTKTIYGGTPEYDKVIGSDYYNYDMVVDMKQIKNTKGKVLWADVEEKKLYLANEDGTEKILINECVKEDTGELPYNEHKEVVMPLTNKQQVVVSLDHMKMYKGKVRLFIDKIGTTPIRIVEL